MCPEIEFTLQYAPHFKLCNEYYNSLHGVSKRDLVKFMENERSVKLLMFFLLSILRQICIHRVV